MEGVTVSGSSTGVSVEEGAVVVNVDGTKIMGNGSGTSKGVSVGRFATRATLTGTVITGQNKGVGVKVEDKKTSANLTLNGVTISKVATGVEMKAGNDLTISGGMIKEVQTGIDMSGSGALTISGKTEIQFTSDNGYGVYVGGGVVTKATLTGTRITGRGSGQGVYVNGGAAWLIGTTLKSVAKGMTVENGIVVMQNGVIKFHGEHGVLLKQGHALLVNVGMKYEGDNADATFLKVDATEGVNKADIKGALIKIDGQGKGLGVHVMNGGRVMLKNTVLANVVKGVDVFLESMFHLFLRLLSVSCVMCVCLGFFIL
ncbi:hypothetical protein BWD121_000930 [Bartonella sp. WD12.1]|nr:hypothetical protein BWD121_000930 [Bartonella sp. WD12.1]